MNIIDSTAQNIARSIRKHYPEAGSEIALRYSLSLIINSTTSMVLIFIISILTHRFYEAVIVLATFLLLRYFTGGVHLNSSLACCLFSVILLSSITFAEFNYYFLGVLFNIIAIIIFLIKAPEGIENISRIDRRYYPLLKLISILIVSTNFIISSSLLSLVFITQAFFLTKLAYNIIHYIERRINI
ncbi:hypothetical protein SY83_20915 [Paenibacillus swuensis]|uniref:Accessory gene regulator AgrB n=1 Tax=Paenibacillus swuensis TaxID=1178515 RepID=A0A172TN70_9BACL|nr:accessory gene regulator B family protein [Paenibacillus swuensis]ANE48334.1 hypothetical protein SY83_20915 [Paenibacillus swuensis]